MKVWANKYVSRLGNVMGSKGFGLFITAYCLFTMVINLWIHRPIWALLLGVVGLANFGLLIVTNMPRIEPINIVTLSPIESERLADLDERLAACARKLGQEPPTEQVIAVVNDLRSIVRDLNP